MTHTAIKRGRASRRSVDPRFKWVNTCLAMLKGAITGTCRAIRRQYAGRDLAAYEYRFNRRFDLPKMIPALAKTAAATAPETLCNPAHSGNIRVIVPGMTSVERTASGLIVRWSSGERSDVLDWFRAQEFAIEKSLSSHTTPHS